MEKQGFKKLLKNTNPPKKLLFLGILLTLITTICSLLVPLLLKQQIENIENGISTILVIKLIGLTIIEILTMAFSLYTLTIVGQQIVLSLRKKLWKKIINMDIEFHNNNESGKISSRMINDTSVTMNLLSVEFAELFGGILSIVGATCILFFLDIPLTLVLLSSIPIMIILIMPISKALGKLSFIYQEKVSNLSGYITKMASEIRLVKAYQTEEDEYEKGKILIEELYKNGIKKAKIESILVPIMQTVMSITILGIVGFGAYRVSLGYISTGELMAFLLYIFQIVTPIGSIGKFITNYQAALGASERIFNILEKNDERIMNQGKNSLSTINGTLEVIDLSFSYGEKPILNNISFKLSPNTTTALVGASGVGKSTLFYLIERFYTPTKGDLKINDVSFKDVSLNDWRKMFSYVSQDIQIISGTIRENIIYGCNYYVDEATLIKVAKQAYCYDFIMSLSDKFETKLGERGINLSGGQKQRIAIARALLRNTPFLLLDEATANLDSESEAHIQKALESLLINRTTVVIAHRISTIENADQIIVLSEGKVSQIGTHKDLIYSNAIYKKLAKEKSQILI